MTHRLTSMLASRVASRLRPLSSKMATHRCDAAISQPKVSERIRTTQPPTVVLTRKYLAGNRDALSLGQGIVYWTPPKEALAKAVDAATQDPELSSYGPDEGLPALREELRIKIAEENGLQGYDVMITAGANQAFVSCLLTLCDKGDGVVLFKPYYFDHAMAIQMTGSETQLIKGQTNPDTLQPDLDWLEARLHQPNPPKMVVIVNPCNPTGVLMSKDDLIRAAEICKKGGAWLVLDNAYEYFIFEGELHCPSAPHILHIFSFSKSYGMMGWRIGYIAYPKFNGDPSLELELVKVQDCTVVCASQVGQRLALECLRIGRHWVDNLVKSLEPHREAAREALAPLEKNGHVVGGEGALYFWAKLPPGCEDDEAAVEWLVRKHGVCLIPGVSCGAPGHVRVSFANQPLDKCREACGRLKRGLEELSAKGVSVYRE